MTASVAADKLERSAALYGQVAVAVYAAGLTCAAVIACKGIGSNDVYRQVSVEDKSRSVGIISNRRAVVESQSACGLVEGSGSVSENIGSVVFPNNETEVRCL